MLFYNEPNEDCAYTATFPSADLWIVHGMLKDRNDPGQARAVALDAET